jgi:hypothetical protein
MRVAERVIAVPATQYKANRWILAAQRQRKRVSMSRSDDGDGSGPFRPDVFGEPWLESRRDVSPGGAMFESCAMSPGLRNSGSRGGIGRWLNPVPQ